ncbi:hypothetical protein BGZ61DRAFT_544178 [Ilyonectria robusta]|uniref:uncharacterized protein n=1 Tax=Ilyonectria robusta TaxID=1079257 RepID=UPI001E8E1807|nr:uncharacterized protein BGZ61DRAFT_544178 [Ilyonectria robusta]KAH8737957.1 hypothetical protein BGZ61DRAFT_544178 [Ilyonectria robusta]
MSLAQLISWSSGTRASNQSGEEDCRQRSGGPPGSKFLGSYTTLRQTKKKGPPPRTGGAHVTSTVHRGLSTGEPRGAHGRPSSGSGAVDQLRYTARTQSRCWRSEHVGGWDVGWSAHLDESSSFPGHQVRWVVESAEPPLNSPSVSGWRDAAGVASDSPASNALSHGGHNGLHLDASTATRPSSHLRRRPTTDAVQEGHTRRRTPDLRHQTPRIGGWEWRGSRGAVVDFSPQNFTPRSGGELSNLHQRQATSTSQGRGEWDDATSPEKPSTPFVGMPKAAETEFRGIRPRHPSRTRERPKN